ncbi:MAG TPA: hypothetical protein DIW44_13380 [Anaerolineaceae bacterium]|nr:hypothetical protein [Anaerolineaceae bacterium]
MKNKALRFITIILVITVVTGIIVLAIGLIDKWLTEIQFSNGNFYGGGVLLVVGLINAIGARTDDRMPGIQRPHFSNTSLPQLNLGFRICSSGYDFT